MSDQFHPAFIDTPTDCTGWLNELKTHSQTPQAQLDHGITYDIKYRMGQSVDGYDD